VSTLILISLIVSAQPQPQPQSTCVLAASDRSWVDELIETWRGVAGTVLRIQPDPLPLIVIFDESCVWRIGAKTEGSPHNGTIPLPDGETAPARLSTFTGTFGPEDQPYLVMAMPSIWRADAKNQANPNLPLLIRALFAHEMAHTVQSQGIAEWLNDVEKRLKLPEGLDDDIIQTRFGNNSEFVAAFAAERGLLFQAAGEENASVRRALLTTAVSLMEARRRRFFSGENAVYGELEDIFLTVEGLGQWVAYQVARQNGMSPPDAQDFIRGGRNRWSRDEGLAAFLVIDALVPGWRDRVLKGRPASVFVLLAEAARR
jgi:hypothetical protein